MPKIVDSMGELPSKKADAKWDEFADGQIREFTDGVDFKCKRDSFLTEARSQATRRGMKVRTKSTGQHIFRMQFYKP